MILPAKTEPGKVEISTVETEDTTDVHSVPPEQLKQSSEPKKLKEKKSMFGNPLSVLGTYMGSKQDTKSDAKSEPKKAKIKSKLDVSQQDGKDASTK